MKQYTEEDEVEVRVRLGCDMCEDRECPTERFDGYTGHILWFCNECIKDMQAWTQGSK